MNQFVLGALALTVASTPSLAGSNGSDNAWLETDQDLNALASSFAPAGSGVSVSGFLRTSYSNSNDFTVPPGNPAGSNDLGGFSIDQARLIVTGSVGQFSALFELEGSNYGQEGVFGATGAAGGVTVLDAYASWAITDELKLQAGQFRVPFLTSALRAENNLLFIDRSLLGTSWAGRDQGVQLSGTWGMISATLAVQNGIDTQGKDLAWSGRVQATPMGQVSAHEGALGAPGDPSLTVGVAGYKDDDTVDKRTAYGADAYFTVGIFSASAEVVHYDDNHVGNNNANPASLGLFLPNGLEADNSPWDIAVSAVVIPDQLEVAVRYEDADDSNNTSVVTVGANWYCQGHAAKFQLNYSHAKSDNPGGGNPNLQDGDVVAVGMTVSI
jgi:hypothetical protein